VSDALYRLIKSCDTAMKHRYSYHEVQHEWPEGELARLVAARLLHPIESADRVHCMECWNLEEVHYMRNQGKTAAYVQCSRCGANQVPSEWLQQWQMSCDDLIRIVMEQLSPSGPRNEVVRDRIWCLGKVRLAQANRNIYFGRALDEVDSWEVIQQAGIASRSVLFTPALTPKADPRTDAKPIVIPLTNVLSWQGDDLHFDREFVEAEVADLTPTDPVVSPQKRGSRLSLIERLTNEMSQHLLAARDYAFTEQSRTGEARLLPRPTKEILARQLSVHPSSVTRAFQDEKARDLNYLWELANDLERIMEFAGNRVKLQ